MEQIKKIINEQTEKGYTITTGRFFRKIGISRRRWNQIISGEREPRLSEIKSISKFFEVSINELVAE